MGSYWDDRALPRSCAGHPRGNRLTGEDRDAEAFTRYLVADLDERSNRTARYASGCDEKNCHIASLALMALDCAPSIAVYPLPYVGRPASRAPRRRRRTATWTLRSCIRRSWSTEAMTLPNDRGSRRDPSNAPHAAPRLARCTSNSLPVPVVGIDGIRRAVKCHHRHGSRCWTRAGKRDRSPADRGHHRREITPSWLVIRAPPEKPVTKMRFVSMHSPASSVVIVCWRKSTSFGVFAGTLPPPRSGCPGTFQSKPDPSAIAACGYATMKPSASAVAFIPVKASCADAVDSDPWRLRTSGVF